MEERKFLKKFSKLPWAIVFAEEYAREMKNRILQELKPMFQEIRRGPLYTEPFRLEDYKIYSTERVFYREGEGLLREVMIKSPSTSFAVAVDTNRGTVIDDTYSNLANISMELDFLTAIPKDGYYIVKVANVYYNRWARVVINVTTPITFKEIRVIHDVFR